MSGIHLTKPVVNIRPFYQTNIKKIKIHTLTTIESIFIFFAEVKEWVCFNFWSTEFIRVEEICFHHDACYIHDASLCGLGLWWRHGVEVQYRAVSSNNYIPTAHVFFSTREQRECIPVMWFITIPVIWSFSLTTYAKYQRRSLSGPCFLDYVWLPTVFTAVSYLST